MSEDTIEINIDEEIPSGKSRPKATKRPKVEPNGQPNVPWENIDFKVDATQFADAMRAHGLHTYEDARTNTKLVVGLLQAAYKVDLGVVLAFAKKHEEVD